MSRDKELLPLCDLLFNIISLAGYSSDLVFGLTSAWALHRSGLLLPSYLTLGFVLLGLTLVQIPSLKWFWSSGLRPRFALILVHCTGSGLLWRYCRLFLPVDLAWVKLEVRDLCLLRLLHAFGQSAPLLLLHLDLLLSGKLPPGSAETGLRDLVRVVAALSLFSVCWSLASFSKNVRTRNVHKLVLTWLGVIFQFTWRLGTVGTRAVCLVLYSTLVGPWVLLVVLLHWISMFLWIVSTGSLFKVDEPTTLYRTFLSSVIAFVYIFAYINLQETGRHVHKMCVYYAVMTAENGLLCFAWRLGNFPSPLPIMSKDVFLLSLCLLYMSGVCFMLLYYKCFHVRRLNYQSGGRMNDPVEPSSVEIESPAVSPSSTDGEPKKYRVYGGPTQHHHGGIPGVFNCRFTNPYSVAISNKRKKKKPTSFVPPPSILPSNHCPVPFWCRPLVSEEKVMSRPSPSLVDIRAKIEEKKRKQLIELASIEEEMRRVGAPVGSTSPAIIYSTASYNLPNLNDKKHKSDSKRSGSRKMSKVCRYVPPANSSDGDVDSAEEPDEPTCWTPSPPQLRLNSRFKHETKL